MSDFMPNLSDFNLPEVTTATPVNASNPTGSSAVAPFEDSLESASQDIQLDTAVGTDLPNEMPSEVTQVADAAHVDALLSTQDAREPAEDLPERTEQDDALPSDLMPWVGLGETAQTQGPTVVSLSETDTEMAHEADASETLLAKPETLALAREILGMTEDAPRTVVDDSEAAKNTPAEIAVDGSAHSGVVAASAPQVLQEYVEKSGATTGSDNDGIDNVVDAGKSQQARVQQAPVDGRERLNANVDVETAPDPFLQLAKMEEFESDKLLRAQNSSSDPDVSALDSKNAITSHARPESLQQTATTAQRSVNMLHVNEQLSSPNWQSAFNARIHWLVKQGSESANIQLDPPELGPIQVRIQMHSDGANIHFTSHVAEVRDAVESALPRLRDLMADQGVNLSHVDVSDQSPKERGAESYDAPARRLDREDAELMPEVSQYTQHVSLNRVDFYV